MADAQYDPFLKEATTGDPAFDCALCRNRLYGPHPGWCFLSVAAHAQKDAFWTATTEQRIHPQRTGLRVRGFDIENPKRPITQPMRTVGPASPELREEARKPPARIPDKTVRLIGGGALMRAASGTGGKTQRLHRSGGPRWLNSRWRTTECSCFVGRTSPIGTEAMQVTRRRVSIAKRLDRTHLVTPSMSRVKSSKFGYVFIAFRFCLAVEMFPSQMKPRWWDGVRDLPPSGWTRKKRRRVSMPRGRFPLTLWTAVSLWFQGRLKLAWLHPGDAPPRPRHYAPSHKSAQHPASA